MRHILMMETGSFRVVGGAAKDVYRLYEKLGKRKDYRIDLYGDFSKVDKSAKTVSRHEFMSKRYDFVWMNSVRDIPLAERYRELHIGNDTKFMYTDRGNVLLNSRDASWKMLLPKMIARTYLINLLKDWLDYYIAISSDQYEYAEKFFRERTKVSYIIIAPHEEYKVLKVRKAFDGAISVSRLDERQKKLRFMIMGIARVKKDHPPLKDRQLLRIIGTGIDEENYKRLSKSLGLEKNIIFLGFMTGKPLIKEYNNSGFLVSTSEWEGLGRSLLEAMACGLPLLINDNINTVIKARPTVRLVTDGSNGLVYRYGDEEDFSRKFYRLYSDRRMRSRLSANTRKLIRRFSFGTVVKGYENLIDGKSG